jgi:hypothetical protein
MVKAAEDTSASMRKVLHNQRLQRSALRAAAQGER